MKKKQVDKQFNGRGIIFVPQYKKIWYAITKFEKYPEMAAEGVGRAILYLTQLLLVFAVVIAIAMIIKLNSILNESVQYLDKNIKEMNYENGNLSIELVGEENKFVTDFATVIVDTDKTEYEGNTFGTGTTIIWLKDHLVLKFDGRTLQYDYSEILNQMGITEFDKAEFIKMINTSLTNKTLYISYFVIITLYVLLTSFIAGLLDVLILSIFGVITSMFARIKMRYRAVFNMSIYAITISTILQLIYMLVEMFTTFEIKYFDMMYTAISYICLTAAIFMIKSDVIKQHIELMKIIEEKRENPIEKTKEEEEQEEKEDSENKDEKKKEKEKVNDEAEGQGSNA